MCVCKVTAKLVEDTAVGGNKERGKRNASGIPEPPNVATKWDLSMLVSVNPSAAQPTMLHTVFV